MTVSMDGTCFFSYLSTQRAVSRDRTWFASFRGAKRGQNVPGASGYSTFWYASRSSPETRNMMPQ